MTPERADRETQPSSAASAQDPFATLRERCRAHERDLAAIARETDAILLRREEAARAEAERLLIQARAEAAALLSDARREVSVLGEQVTALRQAQLQAARALEQTRRALDEALAMADAQGRTTVPPGPSSPRAARSEAFSRYDSPAGGSRPVQGSGEPASSSRLSSSTRWWALGGAIAGVTVAGLSILWLARVASDGGDRWRPSDTPSGHVAATTSTEVREAAPKSPAGSPGPTPLVVELEARRPSWVRATIDGRQEKGGILQAGQRRRMTASTHLAIRTGDAGALLLSVNGEPARPFGIDGQVRTRQFGSARSSAAADESRTAAPSAEPAVPAEIPRVDAAPVPGPPPAMIATTGGASPALAAASTSHAPQRPSVPDTPAAARRDEGAASNVTREILDADRRWFEAHYGGDNGTVARLSAEGFEFADTRPRDRRAPPASSPQRVLEDARVDVHGDGAVLSGRMIERVARDGSVHEYESFVSQVWVRREGTWRLLGLRIAEADSLRETAGAPR